MRKSFLKRWSSTGIFEKKKKKTLVPLNKGWVVKGVS